MFLSHPEHSCASSTLNVSCCLTPTHSLHISKPPGLFLSCWYLPVLPSSTTSTALFTMPPYLSLGYSLAMSTWMFPTPSRWAIPETVYIWKQLESLENFQQRSVMWSDLYFKGSWIGKRLLRLRLCITAFSDTRPGCYILRLFSCLCINYLWPDL